jgi:dTDP-4-dehydrorhamnose reductase
MIIGFAGQLGSELMSAFEDCSPMGFDHAAIEIEDPASVEAAFALAKPTLVINTAAFHNVDECERRPDRAFAVNAIAVDRLAAASMRCGAAFATISTDYVFNGKAGRPYGESDDALPANLYGVSKRAGELCVMRGDSRHFVFRTSGLYGLRTASQKGYTFVDRIIRQVEAGETPSVVVNMTFSPSYAVDIAAAIRWVVEREAYGLHHLTNSGGCTWYDFAREALRLAGLSTEVTPLAYRDFESTVERPLYSVLAHESLDRLGITIPRWEDGLRRYVATRAARVPA